MEGVGYITAHSYVCISKVTQKTYMLVFTIQFWSTKPRSHEVFSRDSPTYITFALTKWSQRAEYGESISSSSGTRVILLKSFLLFRFAPKLQQSWQTLQKGFNCFISSFKLICRAFPLSKQSLISIDTAVDFPFMTCHIDMYRLQYIFICKVFTQQLIKFNNQANCILLRLLNNTIYKRNDNLFYSFFFLGAIVLQIVRSNIWEINTDKEELKVDFKHSKKLKFQDYLYFYLNTS